MKLYDALMESLLVNENDMDKQLEDQPTEKKRRRDDHDQNPFADPKKEKKKKRKKNYESSKKDKDQADSLKKGKSPSKSSKTDKSVNAEDIVQDDAVDVEQVNEDFHDVVSAKKDPVTFDDVMGSIIDFTKFTNCLQKDKITKADLEGPAFKLLKGNYRIYIELEYNFEQCYLALTDQIDWVNPEGDIIPHDISKPLPLHGALGLLTILVDFFFNKDLDYLTNQNVEKKYATLLTKLKAARTMIKKRVDEVQIRVGSYQEKLNITMPQVRCAGLDDKEPYTIFYEPRGVVYLNKDNNEFMMRADEVYKFVDGTLKKVRDKLDYMLHNFELRYNDGMLKRAWTDKDKKQIASMLEKIEKTLLTRRIMRSLKCFIVEEESRRTTDF
ncbi:hypothetical protein Tco_1310722 [Tanacetum coccineum]